MTRRPRTSKASKALRDEYQALYAAVLQHLTRADFIGLAAGGAPANEYEPEVGTIVPRLRSASSPADVSAIVHEEFSHWFSADLAGDRGRFTTVGHQIWAAYQTHTRELNRVQAPSDL